VYLGAAPGVGKTFAMLDEGYRRRQRGADVVVGLAETHGRANTIAQVRDLEVIPRRTIQHRGATFAEMDVEAILARKPQVALVDELAHTNVPGSANEKRWQDVEQLLDAGIEVITTLNIQHLESLNDLVETITGIVQRETVPDAVVRSADQIELVDMSPEALRKRMAHGNIYPPERVQPALENYFRPGNLGALRELALLWVADRVEDALHDYRARHGMAGGWETRERIVVAVTGAPGSEQLIRRAARIASRSHGQLIGVHVSAPDGLRAPDAEALARHRDLVLEMGGIYREVAGHEVAPTLTAFAQAEGATQLVLGASQRSRFTEFMRGSVIGRTLGGAAGIDVHIIASGTSALLPSRAGRARLSGLPWRRRLVGWAMVAFGLPLLTAVLVTRRADLSFATELLLYLLLAVASGAAGGVGPAVTGAIGGSLLVNYYLVQPLHTLTITEAENVFALVVFVIVAVTVSGFVTLASRRAYDARRLRAEAEGLARTTATLAGAADPLPMLLDQMRVTFALAGAAVLRPVAAGAWITEASAGDAPESPTAGTAIELGSEDGAVLVLGGGNLDLDDRRLLHAHAEQLGMALKARRLQQELARAAVIEEADALRTALLQAVSHDLRAPLANIKADVTSLLSSEVSWDPATEREFLVSIDEETDRLNRLVGNLLDMSRLQAGVLTLHLGPVALEEVVSTALASLNLSAAVTIDIDEGLPFALADGDLLERAVANVIANAVRFSREGDAVVVTAAVEADRCIHLRIIDNGPGIDEGLRAAVLRPFQRLGDGPSGTGVGLGLAVANGFVSAMGGTFSLGDTPGRGLTVDIALPSCPDGTEELA
jgi:two-component system, OmpR family, sensor histidine kinase KdpD